MVKVDIYTEGLIGFCMIEHNIYIEDISIDNNFTMNTIYVHYDIERKIHNKLANIANTSVSTDIIEKALFRRDFIVKSNGFLYKKYLLR